ncbi:adenylate/guanylate cyclase domain-containing protein [Inquilinus sp. Marseille-Q2685]|uniref:adenylate/guanylate cyclase domain-containing protein n=1 Tax=Inquilinus sp. Marseille-Q2685 TaxID=2866581 RepID=UPI001CE3D04F|nr:adenylate/guanylate cyclase domain-containing protein [Inquilinus sp. Marseille-Q2685]
MLDPDEIIGWLLGPARALPSPAPLLQALAERLVQAGYPLWRLTFLLPQFHPLIGAASYEWRPALGQVREIRFERERADGPGYQNSPMGLMHRSGRMVRRRLVGPEANVEFPLLQELRAEGAADYVLMPMRFGIDEPRTSGFSMVSDRPDGFSADQIALVQRILPALGAVCEIMIDRQKMAHLLETYVGREASRRILEGEVVRGGARSLEAVILFCDMRGFTARAEATPRDALLQLMNEYFTIVVGAVHGAGGEVLKFMGDGILAIFRLGDGEAAEEACARGLIGALEAFAGLDAMNDRRRAEGLDAIDAGIALHVGEVIFGNIGAPDRLDFTVVGPEVNRAARIEQMTKLIGRRILTSSRFAELSPVRLISAGTRRLRGVAEPQELFTPAPDLRGETIPDAA